MFNCEATDCGRLRLGGLRLHNHGKLWQAVPLYSSRELRRSPLNNEFPQSPKRMDDTLDITFVTRKGMDDLLLRKAN